MNNESNNNGNVNYDVDPNMIFGNNPINGVSPDNQALPTSGVPSVDANAPVTPVAATPMADANVPATPVAETSAPVAEVPTASVAPEQSAVVNQTPEVNTTPVQSGVEPNNMNMPNDNGTTAYVPEEPKKSKAPLIIIVVVLLACLCVGGYFAYNMFFANPFTRISNKLLDDLKKQSLGYDKPFKVSGDVAIESQDASLAVLNDLSFTYDITANPDGTKGLVNASIMEKGNKLLGVESYVDNNKVYMKLNELTDKVLYTEVEKTNDSNSIFDKDEATYVIEKMITSYVDALKGEKLNKESVELKLNGNTIKATSNYYLINNSNYKKIFGALSESLTKDEKLIKILAKYTQSTTDEVKEILGKMDDEVPFDNGNDNVKIAIYTKGFLNDFAGFAIRSKIDTKEMTILNFVTDNESLSCAVDLDTAKLTFEGKLDNIKMTMSTTGSDGNSEELMTGSIVTLSKDNYAFEVDFMKQYKIKMKAKITANQAIAGFDTNNAVKVDDLTEEDATVIQQNLEKVLQKSETYAKVMESLQTQTTEYNYGG